MNVGLALEISDAGALAAILDNNITLTRTITITGDEESPADASNDIRFDAVEIDASLGIVNAAVAGISVINDTITEDEEVVVLTLTDDNNVLPQGWSIDPANNTMTITIPANDSLPTVSLSSTSADMDIAEGGTATITLTLSEALGSDAMFHLVTGGDAGYGLTSGGDWVFTDISCVSDGSRNACPVTISQNSTTATANIMIVTDTTTERREPFTVTLEIDSGSTSIVQAGSPSVLNFAVEATQHTISFSSATGTADVSSSLEALDIINIAPPPIEAVDIPISITGDSDDYIIGVRPEIGGSPSSNALRNGVFTYPVNATRAFVNVAGRSGRSYPKTVVVSLGTLPDNYMAGTNGTWTVTITQ